MCTSMTLKCLCCRLLQLNDTFTQLYRELDNILPNECRLKQENSFACMGVEVDIIA